MKHINLFNSLQEGSTLKRVGMILALCLITITQVWGASPLSVSAPTKNFYTQDGVTVQGRYMSTKINNESSQDVFTTYDSTSIFIYSLLTNISTLSFKVCYHGSGVATNSFDIYTSTGGAFSIPTTGFTATKDESSLTSLSNISINGNSASENTISLSFSSNVKAIVLKKNGKDIDVRGISIAYTANTLPTTYYAAHISNHDEGTIDTNPGEASTTVDTDGKNTQTVGDLTYYKLNSATTIDLGTGHTFTAGDQIVVDVAGGGKNKTYGIQIQTGDGTAVATLSAGTIGCNYGTKLFYVVQNSDGIQGQQTAKFMHTDANTRVYSYSVLRAAASCTAPTAVYVTQTEGVSDLIAGESFTLSAATSTGVQEGATYQWYRGSTEVGTNSPTYTVSSCTSTDAGTYWCKITNPCSADAHTTNSTGYGIKVWQVLLYSSSWNAYDLTSTGTKTGEVSRRLTPGTYYVKLTHNNGTDFGVNTGGTISEITGTTPTPWTLYGSQNNIKLTVTTAGYYTFAVNYTSADNPTLGVTYPSATISGCDKIYFCPTVNSIATGSAKFSIYFYNASESAWANCYLVSGTDYADDAKYVAYAPSSTNGWTKMIVVRYSSYISSWDNKWNQSEDITYNGYDCIVGRNEWTSDDPKKFKTHLNSFYSSDTPEMDESEYCVIVGGTTTASTNLPSSAVTYTSANNSVATVGSSTGVITGVAAGSTTITAKVGSCTVGSATVTVYAAPSVSLSSSSVTYGGSAPTLTASNFATITGYSSATTGTATINGSGVISIVAAGTTTFTVTGTDGCGNAANPTTSTFTVNKADISPELSYSSTTLTYGGSASSTPTITGNTGEGSVTYAVTASSPSGCITVNSSTGVVTPVAAGTGTVTATIGATTNYNGNTATADFTVNKASPTTYTFSADNTSICSGDDVTFTIAGSQVGATYYITKSSGGGSAIGDSKEGNGSSLSFKVSSATAGDYYCWTSATANYNAAKVSKSKVTISYKTATSVSFSDYTLDATVDESFEITGISAAGSGTLTYQWYSYSDDEGSDETEIDGADEASYTFTPDAEDNYYFKCAVTGDCGTVKSDIITVTASVSGYTVTYKANNDTEEEDVELDSQTTFADNGTSPDFTAPATKAFTGWNSKADGTGTHYDVGDDVTAETTVYAEWKYKVYYIASSTSESNDITTTLATNYVVSVKETTGTSYNTSDYSDYALVVLSESLDGSKAKTSTHELRLIKGLNKPILNLKSYFYNMEDNNHRWDWGTPNAGKKPKNVYVKNGTYANLTSHPIYTDLTPDGNDSISVLSSLSGTGKPIQPVGSFASGCEGYSLALVPNNSGGGSGTAIHELTAAQRSAITSQTITSKYLMISIQSAELSNLSSDGETLIKNAADYLITGSQWVPQYTITYDKGSADGASGDSFTGTKTHGTSFSLSSSTSAFTRSGYTYDGWSTSADGSTKDYNLGDSYTTDAAITLYPHWVVSCTKPGTPTRPTIEDGTLTHAGATFVWDPEGVTAHSNGYVVSIVKVSDGSTVLDWTSSGIYTEGGAGGLYDATGLTGSTEYYFIVKAIGAVGYCAYGDTSRLTFTTLGTPYTITYHLNGASWINEGAATYRYGTGYTLPVASDMSNTGYTFNGWKNNSGLTGDNITAIGTSDYGDKEFWAKWTENTYTITYDANGGTGTTSSTNGHYVTVANNGFTAPSGKVFAGWNTKSGGDGDSYGEGDEIELTANMTLYAIWATDYDISWGNAQYGGADETPKLGGGNYTITASVATWTGTLTTSMISTETSGVTITSVAVDNSASPKTITATFNVGASVAGTSIKMQLDVPAYGVYGAKSSEKSITIDRCSGGESSTVVFSQNFSSVGAGSVAYAADTKREYMAGGTTITGIVGSGANEFTYIGQAKKGNAGVAVNSSTGGNSVDATGMFQAYCNNTGGNYALVRNSDFAATAPTALKVSMKIWFQQGSSGSDYSVTFAVGDGFSNSYSAPDASNVHSGFSILNNSNAYLSAYKSKTVLSGTNKLTQGSDLTMVWVINNSGQTLSYTDPASNTSTLANDKFDVWIGTTRFIAGANATTASKALQELYIGDPAGKNHQLRLDDIVVTDISPAVSSITPTLTWDDDEEDIATSGVTKDEGDADFTYTASQNKNSLGAITYESSNTSVATVNETTGKVHIVGDGKATITATIAESGCYEDASVTYTLTVNEKACSDAAGTIKNNDGSTITDNAITKSSCETVALKLVGYADGATIQWYKDGEEIDGATAASYTIPTSGSGVYSAISSSTCDRNSTNEITVTNSASVSATKIVDNWYVKAGRRTPDIALVQTTDAASFQVKISSTVIWSTVSGSEVTTGLGGCGFYLGKDGIIYLKGTKNNGNATDDITSDQTLSFVVTNACGTNADDPGNITIKRQASTSRPSVAYVSVGTANGTVTDTTAGYYKTTALYKYLDNTLGGGNFDLTAQNAYWSVSEKELKEHYSQFDAILITDDPSTDKKNKKGGTSFIDAIGSLVDVRPILTMEAYVSKLSNWKAKGIDGNPSSPNPRQYGMTLQCKDHEIFGDLDVGDNVKEKTIDGTTYWTVLMVDSTKSPYSGVAYNSETKDKPALQGFAASDVSGLLLLGEISNGTLYAGVERQEEPAARLMVLGINAKALPNALTNEGKIIIKNSLGYLLKTNMEEVDDCSNYFTGAAGTTDWNTATNWSKAVVPNSPMIRARILAPCEITGITVKAAQIDIVTSGTSSKKAGELTGKLTINPTGALIVGGKIRAAEAPYFSIEDLKPTEEEDLVLNTNSSNQAALVFNNDNGDTKATVNLYSLGRKISSTYQFQYMAVPMDYVSVSESFAGSGIYTYVWNEASGWERRGYYTDLFAFEGVGITTKFGAAKDYTMKGTLASTETKEIALTNDADGINMIGNSWTAPIQISKLEEDNSATEINQTVYIYCTGNGNTVIDGTTETPGQWLAIPFSAAGFKDWDGLKVIPAMQAFDIKVSGTSTLTLDYDKLVRGGTTDMNAKLRAPKRNVAHEGIDLTRIRVADSKTHTDLYLFEGDQFSDEFDNGWEAEFMSGDGRSAQLYAQTELGKMAVIALPEIEGTVLGFVPGQESVYTFHFTGANNGYYLNDLKLLQSTPIDETSTYTFTYEEGDTNRFIISSTPINKIVTGNENVGAEAAKVRKLIIDDKVYIIRGGKMYSVDGTLVK